MITHWSPVEVSASSRWIVGAAIETIVWSIDIIATAKIIAVRTRYRLPMDTSSIRPADAPGP